MKRICITYHLERLVGKPSDSPRCYDNAENCITTEFEDEIADATLAGLPLARVKTWLAILAELQGFSIAAFRSAEIASYTKGED